jgi:hypothetical protein
MKINRREHEMRIDNKHFLYNLSTSTIKKLLFEMFNLYGYLKN